MVKKHFIKLFYFMLVFNYTFNTNEIYAQPTANAYDQWFFGNALHDVQNNAALNNPLLSGFEQSASYCDNAGNIWFYTDGRNITNVATGTTLNGVLNSSPNAFGSAAQGVLILPQLGGLPNRFWIFTTSDAQSVTPINNGLSFYTYDAGTNTVNGPFSPTTNFHTTEGLTAIPHCNGTDFWIIVKPVINPANINVNNTFIPSNPTGLNVDNTALLAYQVSAGGVANTPVVSNFNGTNAYSPSIAGNPLNWVSVMKSSPDRQLFAIGERDATGGANNFINLYRFNCGTGQFNFITREVQNNFPYGISFSPNSNYLYSSDGNSRILQRDVSNIRFENNACDSISVDTILLTNPNATAIYQLQLDNANGRIVIANWGDNALDCITQPNLLAPAGYAANFYQLNIGATSHVGMPNNIDGLINTLPDPVDFDFCVCGCRVYFDFIGCGNSITWDFGDGTVITGAPGATVQNSPNTQGNYTLLSHSYATSGTYQVTVTVDGQPITHTVVFNSADDCTSWNVSTLKTDKNDISNDIVTDANGNIYIAGTFDMATTFSPTTGSCDVTIVSGGTPGSAYIAKFNSCGELIWVNYDAGSGISQGRSLAFDATRNIVYMTGQGKGNMRFQSVAARSCVSPVAGPNVTNVSEPYVAAFNATTGGYLHGYYFNSGVLNLKDPVNIAVRNLSSSSTEIYYSFTYITGTSDRIAMKKLTNTAGGYSVTWTTQSIPTGARPVSNDLVYDPAFNRVYITGETRGILVFPGAAPAIPGQFVTADAFIASFNAATGLCIANRSLGISGTQNFQNIIATGTSVSVDGAGGVYYTGHFNQPVTNVMGTTGISLTGISGQAETFIVRVNPGTFAAVWAREINSAFGEVRASGICNDINRLTITGTFTNNITAPATFTPNGTYTGAGANNVFIARYVITGTPLWLNATQNNIAGTNSISTRIAARGNYTYSTGGYTGEIDYNFTGVNPPPSGALISSPVSGRNSYIIRNSIPFAGEFRLDEETSEDEIQKKITLTSENSEEDILIYPNPASESVNLQSDSEIMNGVITVMDMQGRIIITEKMNGYNVKIDVSQLDNGMYFVTLKQENKSTTKKFNIAK